MMARLLTLRTKTIAFNKAYFREKVETKMLENP